jgi:hypothetical protein
MSNRTAAAWAAIIGLGIIIVAFILAVMPVHRDGVNCGNAFAKSDDASFSYYVYGPNSCDDALAARRTAALALGVPGVLLTIGAGIACAAMAPTPERIDARTPVAE